MVTQEQLPVDKDRQEKLIIVRDQQNVYRREMVSPLDRGWTGGKMPGKSIGPPEPIGEGIQSIIFLKQQFSTYI